MAADNLFPNLVGVKPRNRSTVDIAWAAGFLEGEGSFINEGTPHVSAGQVQRQPLEKLQILFGGRIWQRNTHGFSKKPIWIWNVPAWRSVEIMMTVYPLMSPARQDQIERALAHWKAARLFKRPGTGVCGRGHQLTSESTYLVRGKYTRCRLCSNERKRVRRQKPNAV